ncbi:MAG TPA: hypothetical protein VNV44_07145 [Solirubrobacteraceae bacterium]|nr:hypothetical protein [Solirubrobacteraceae bacterium]
MSGAGEGNGRGDQPLEGGGVLANLPRTRPQRASPRRAAARRATAEEDQAAANGNGRAKRPTAKNTSAAKGSARRSAAASPRGAKPAKTTRPPRAAKGSRRRAGEAVPRQGYESVEERATGPVQPPGGTELLGTAAEVVSELAKAGVSGGERVLRDLFSRLGR